MHEYYAEQMVEVKKLGSIFIFIHCETRLTDFYLWRSRSNDLNNNQEPQIIREVNDSFLLILVATGKWLRFSQERTVLIINLIY